MDSSELSLHSSWTYFNKHSSTAIEPGRGFDMPYTSNFQIITDYCFTVTLVMVRKVFYYTGLFISLSMHTCACVCACIII